MRTLVMSLFAVLLAFPAFAADSQFHALAYRAENHWVHQDDIAPLNELSAEAMRTGADTFEFKLPENADENLYLDRLVILRDILDKRLKRKVNLVQVPGEAPENAISMRSVKP